MKRQYLFIMVALVFTTSVWAQEFKLAKSTGELNIQEVNNVRIEGYSGNEIVFTSSTFSRDRDDRANGLRAISSMGLEDNTGLGLSVVETNGTIEVRQLKKMDGPNVLIKVPQGVNVKYVHTSPYGDDVTIKNFAGELYVSTVHNDVQLMNVTGELTIRTVHGDIDASFSSPINKTVSLTSTHGHVDAALPIATKANLKLSTSWGEIFVDPDFKLEFDKSGTMIKYSDKMTAKINGGGTEITLSSTHDNVYLRKK
ncbi:MAG: DUF4097 family beta strand repeat protein [Cyclobacteriaceae bacterium]|nr:DUF4097 family beta strand repeat protein [Cyclobacteriaceae bacterium]